MHKVKVKIKTTVKANVRHCAPVVVSDGFTPLSITNSDGSVIIPLTEFPDGGIFVLADVEHTDSNGNTIITPALLGFQATQCEEFEGVMISNTSKTWSVVGQSGESIEVPDSIVTEVDGSQTTSPAVDPVVCSWIPINIINSQGGVVQVLSAFPKTGTLTLGDVVLQEVDGSTTQVPIGNNPTCQFFAINLRNSLNEIIGLIGSFPQGGNFPLPDNELTEIDGSTRDIAAGRDAVCSWYQIDVVNTLGNKLAEIPTFPSGQEVLIDDIEHTDSDGDPVTLPAGVPMVCTPGVGEVETIFRPLNFREPFYPSVYSGDYPDLWSQGLFEFYERDAPVRLMKLSDQYTLHPSNPNMFGGLSRYHSTDGTPSDPASAVFSNGYGNGVPNLIIDSYHGIMFPNFPQITNVAGTTQYGLLDSWLQDTDPQVTELRWGKNDWFIPTREMITNTCFPDSNGVAHDNPNPIIDSGTRRYLTCERYPSQGFLWAVYMLGGEIQQSETSTISGQNKVIPMRFIQAADIIELTS